MKKVFLIIPITLGLSGCVGGLHPRFNKSPVDLVYNNAPVVSKYAMPKLFTNLPQPGQPAIPIALYSFTDKTGQRKPSSTLASFSTAVTQGAEAYVIKTLKDVGGEIGRAHV